MARSQRSAVFPLSVGAQLANVPRNTFSTWSTFDLPWHLSIGGGADFVDSRTASSTTPLDPVTGLVKQVPGYWVFNAMAKYPLSEHVDLRVNVYNLADKYYYDQIHPAHIVPGRRVRRCWASLSNSEREREIPLLLPIPEVLTSEQVAEARQILDQAEWVDGRVTAGHQSARTKDNMQLPENHPAARATGRDDSHCAGAESSVCFGGAAGARLSSAVQPLSGRTILRHARGQCHPAGQRNRTPHSHRSLGHFIFLAAG